MTRNNDINFGMRMSFYLKAAGIALLSIWYSLRVIFTGYFGKNKKLMFTHVRRWADKVLAAAGISVTVHDASEGRSGAFIYASNHSSLFDIPVMLSSIDDNVRIIYKKELEKIPVFGWGLKVSHHIAIERSDPRNALAAIEKTIEKISSGDSVIIYPEGTRSKDGKLQEFKRGAFTLAARSGKPVVPVTIVGTNQIMRPGERYFRASKVKIHIGSPIEKYPQNRKEEMKLMQEVRERIVAVLEKESGDKKEIEKSDKKILKEG